MSNDSNEQADSSAAESKIPLRRFEFKDDKSYKFWSIELDDKSHTVTYGRIGRKGQTSTKDFADAKLARTSYEKLIEQKKKKGYREVVKQPVAKKPAAEILRERKLHEPFEQAIINDPNELGNYVVYSDWLTERGDPLGEFIRVQLALEDGKQALYLRAKLEKQEKSMLATHCRKWLGDLTPYLVEQKCEEYVKEYAYNRVFDYEFARGMLDSVHMGCQSHDFATVFRESPHCRLLRRLVIEGTPYIEERGTVHGREFDEYENTGIFTWIGAQLDNLRYFQLGRDDQQSCHTRGSDAVEVIRGMPRIETLHLEAHHVDTGTLFSLPMPNLRSLTVHHLYKYPLELLADNSSLKNLETLCMFPHGLEPGDDDAYLRLEHLRAIARSEHMQNLKYLQFKASDMGDAGIEEIIASGMLSRLEVLDLTNGCITDEGAEMLAQTIKTSELKNLQRLDLTGNRLTEVGIESLKSTKVALAAKEQLEVPQGDDDREYLWYGDPE